MLREHCTSFQFFKWAEVCLRDQDSSLLVRVPQAPGKVPILLLLSEVLLIHQLGLVDQLCCSNLAYLLAGSSVSSWEESVGVTDQRC